VPWRRGTNQPKKEGRSVGDTTRGGGGGRGSGSALIAKQVQGKKLRGSTGGGGGLTVGQRVNKHKRALGDHS